MDVLILLAIVLVATVLRIHHLDFESLFMDELKQLSIYSSGLADIASMAAQRQQQVPLDYWIGALFFRISESDFFIRLPAAIFGVGTIVVIFLLTLQLTSRVAASVTALLVAVSPYHIFFSQFARPYSISIFFFTGLLAVLFLAYRSERIDWRLGLLLFLVTLCFLMTRTLAPFVVVVSILLLLSASCLVDLYLRRRGQEVPGSRKQLVAIGLMLLALAAYLPFLLKVLKYGGRYTNSQAGSGGLAVWLAGLGKLSLAPMLQAYQVQLEPVGLWLAVPLCLAPFLVYFSSRHRFFKVFLVVLLPVAAVINLYIFQAKSHMPFKPSYAVYLAPLVYLVAAVAIHELLGFARDRRRRWGVVVLGLIAALLVYQSVAATIDSKGIRKMADWRGLAGYLQAEHGLGSLYVFDGYSPPGSWEPLFYGFTHYYKAPSSDTSVERLPFVLDVLKRYYLKPVFLLFYYRDHFLTSRSAYPVIPSAHPGIPVEIGGLLKDPQLEVRQFTGFVVIELKEKGSNALEELLTIVERVIADSANRSFLTEWYLASGALKKVLGRPDWADDLEEAVRLAPADKKEAIRQNTRIIAKSLSAETDENRSGGAAQSATQ